MIKKRVSLFILLAVLSASLESCFVFGVRTHINWSEKTDYPKWYRRNHIRHEPYLYTDTQWNATIRHIYRGNKANTHDHLQPVQYLLFDKNGRLQSFMINCNVHLTVPFRPKWNHEKRFDTFPTITMQPVDTLLTLSKLNGRIRDMSGKAILLNPALYDYTEVVLFSRAFHRISRHLIHQVKTQDKKGFRVKTYYVFGDNDLIWSMSDSAEKAKLLHQSGMLW